MATSENDRDSPRTFVANLVINPETGHADLSILYISSPMQKIQLRESMRQLLDMILAFFKDEQKKVEIGELKEEDQLLTYVQEHDSDTKLNTRSLPEAFKRRRA